MTDLELNAASAKAMGWKVGRRALSVVAYHVEECALITSNDLGGEHVWDPLHNDAQAMALVKRLRLTVGPAKNGQWYASWTNEAEREQITICSCFNRAIVECVAKMHVTEPTS